MKSTHVRTIVGVRIDLWQRSGYAPGSETPPWGWPLTIICAVVIVWAVLGFVSYGGALAGLS